MSDTLVAALREHFGHPDFQPGQRPVVESVLDGVPTVAIMPTGAGKSLCYQLPALMLDGLTLVVSPLIALMKDQVDSLRDKGIRADVINSTRTLDEQRAIMDAARRGDLDLLYVAPERFGNSWFSERINDADIALFAIDEAHCISRWGHDFRPSYRNLGGALERARPRAVLACTATATPEVREDMVASLGLREPRVFVSGFLRDNLFIDVRFCSGDKQKDRLLVDFVRHGPVPADPSDPDHGAIIVYASTRKRVEAIRDLLGRELDESVIAYHAGMEPEDRDAAQEEFMSGAARIVVATNAFGMGVDRSDVRAVIHAGMPRTVEGYYQEIGRAGRDGKQSWCTLLYNANDTRIHEFLINQSESSEHRELEMRKLDAMRHYIHGESCRHRALLVYFGERAPESCPGCSRCSRPPRIRPEATGEVRPEDAEIVRKALAGVARAKGRFGLRRVAAMLAGSRSKEIAASPLSSLSTYGILGSLGVEGCARLLQLLVDEGLCTIVGGNYPLIAIQEAGVEVMTGREDVDFPVPAELRGGRVGGAVRARSSSRKVGAGPPADADPRLIDGLRAWRAAAADGKPAYTVFGNNTLYALAVSPPTDQAEFLAVPGLGKAKWTRFGEELLERIDAILRGDA